MGFATWAAGLSLSSVLAIVSRVVVRSAMLFENVIIVLPILA
jgi:hypothetical protein